MKKFLVFLVMLSLVGVMVLAVDQGAEADVESCLTLIPTPDPIDFGSMIPGGSSTESTTLTPCTSDLSVSVSITGEDFVVDMEADRDGDTVFSAYNGDSFIITADTPITFDTKVTAPIGKTSGAYSGTITYTVLEA